MPVTDLFWEGLDLVLLGMGIVFTFLALLVLAMNGMSRLAHALESKDIHETASLTVPAQGGVTGGGGGEFVAVITAAISRYRSNRK